LLSLASSSLPLSERASAPLKKLSFRAPLLLVLPLSKVQNSETFTIVHKSHTTLERFLNQR
jgi:hypothetical protein